MLCNIHSNHITQQQILVVVLLACEQNLPYKYLQPSFLVGIVHNSSNTTTMGSLPYLILHIFLSFSSARVPQNPWQLRTLRHNF